MDYEAMKADLRGAAFTNPTPFAPNGGSVRHDELAENVEWLTERGASLVIPCGNTGEYYALSTDERVAIVETVVDTMEGDGTVLAGVGGSIKTALEHIERYEAAGADALLVMHPVHTFIHQRGLVEYYRRIIEATDLGVVFYKRGPEITAEHIGTLGSYENVLGVKYAVNDINAFARDVQQVDSDIVWSCGIAERFAPAFAMEGAEGFTTGIGNFVPDATLALMDALRGEDWDRAREIRDVVRPYEDLRAETGNDNTVEAANNVPAVKYGLELAGQYGGPVREPLVDLSEADKERAREYYDRIKNAGF